MKRKIFCSLVLVLMMIGFLLFGVDPFRAFHYVHSGHFNSAREFVTFRRDLWAGTFYDWVRGIYPVRSTSNVRTDSIDPDHPLARKFRSQHLEKVVNAASSHFEKIVTLREWAHRKTWPLVSSDISLAGGTKDAFSLMRDIQQKKTMACGESAALFVQAAGVMGIAAREVFSSGHIMAEAWSQDYKRWIVMDPFFNVHYTQGKIPLSFAELYQIYYERNRSDPEYFYRIVSAIRPTGSPAEILSGYVFTIKLMFEAQGVQQVGQPLADPISSKEFKLKIYEIFRDMTPAAFADFGISLRSDYLIYQYPIWHPRNWTHQWNVLYWTKSVRSSPDNVYQFSGDLRDFYGTDMP